MGKHTLGPLSAGDIETTAICNKDGFVVYRGKPEFTEADARLFAAAPEMLVALKNIENDDGHIPATIWKLRNDAIAKAEGL